MSLLSHLLGLDHHPAVLAAINDAGKKALPQIADGTKVEDAIHAEVAKGAREAVSLLPIPEEEKALAAFWISGMVNAKIAGVLAQYEPDKSADAPPEQAKAAGATALSQVLNVAGNQQEVGDFPPLSAGGQG